MEQLINILTSLLAFIFALGVIIVVHEAGHLLMAKAFGVRVLTFSVGFGNPHTARHPAVTIAW